jgi:hypothetical protein
MLACVPEAIFHLAKSQYAGSEETQAVAKTKTSRKTKSAPRHSTKAASHKTKTSAAKATAHKGRAAGDKEVRLDRRRGSRRDEEKAVVAAKPAAPPVKLERRAKVNRRRQIDPTTCERDYTDDEVEFMNALDDYKRTSGRMFPTCSEVLEVVRSLGYARLSPSELSARKASQAPDLTVVGASVEAEEEDEVLAGEW